MSSAQERGAGYPQDRSGETAPGTSPGMPDTSGTGTTGRGGDATATTTAEPRARVPEARPAADRSGDPYMNTSPAAASGTLLAGTLLVLAGLWSFFVGITGVLTGGFYSNVPTYAFNYSIHSWGWTHVGIGIAVFAVGVCLLLGMAWARYVGVAFAVIDAIANFMFMPYYPIWSIIVIAIDLFIIWALLSVGHRQPA
jgi:hypothetical protein